MVRGPPPPPSVRSITVTPVSETLATSSVAGGACPASRWSTRSDRRRQAEAAPCGVGSTPPSPGPTRRRASSRYRSSTPCCAPIAGGEASQRRAWKAMGISYWRRCRSWSTRSVSRSTAPRKPFLERGDVLSRGVLLRDLEPMRCELARQELDLAGAEGRHLFPRACSRPQPQSLHRRRFPAPFRQRFGSDVTDQDRDPRRTENQDVADAKGPIELDRHATSTRADARWRRSPRSARPPRGPPRSTPRSRPARAPPHGTRRSWSQASTGNPRARRARRQRSASRQIPNCRIVLRPFALDGRSRECLSWMRAARPSTRPER